LIAISRPAFVALAKVNSAKRGVDNLATRLSLLENEVRQFGTASHSAPEPEAAAAVAQGVQPPIPIITPPPIVQEEKIGAAANPEKIRRRNRSSNHSACKTAD